MKDLGLEPLTRTANWTGRMWKIEEIFRVSELLGCHVERVYHALLFDLPYVESAPYADAVKRLLGAWERVPEDARPALLELFTDLASLTESNRERVREMVRHLKNP